MKNEPEFLTIGVLAERFNLPVKALAERIQWANRKSGVAVRKRGPRGQLKEYALEDVRAVVLNASRRVRRERP